MNTMYKSVFHLIFCSILFFGHLYSQSDWELAKNKNDIRIYTRSIENSDIKEFKAVTTVTTSMEKLEKLIDKVESYTAWQANVASAKILKTVSKNELYVYNTTKVPWPVNDRDIIIHSKKTLSNDGTITYNYTCIPDYIAENPDYIRMKNAKGKWQLIPKDNGQIKIIYQFFGDPEGSIPNWIINMFLVDGPFETLTNLRKIVEA